jgi:hypothetical protein
MVGMKVKECDLRAFVLSEAEMVSVGKWWEGSSQYTI